MPVITSRICGICPEAHHIAATKALDAVFGAEPTPVAKKLRELLYASERTLELAFRLYDSCFSCATYFLPGKMPLTVSLRDSRGVLLREMRRKG